MNNQVILVVEDESAICNLVTTTLEAEGYLSDRISLLIRLRERFMWGGASGRCHFQYGAGIKYIF